MNQKFLLFSETINPDNLKLKLNDPRAGGFVSFEGWVRNRNEGRDVTHLEYQAYDILAISEGEKIIAEAKEKFSIIDALVAHRTGDLQIGEIAVVVLVNAVHRGPAFDACEYIIDELKIRVPIWKKEHYSDGDTGWIECHECAKHVH